MGCAAVAETCPLRPTSAPDGNTTPRAGPKASAVDFMNGSTRAWGLWDRRQLGMSGDQLHQAKSLIHELLKSKVWKLPSETFSFFPSCVYPLGVHRLAAGDFAPDPENQHERSSWSKPEERSARRHENRHFRGCARGFPQRLYLHLWSR